MRQLSDYLNLVTSWHRGKPKYTATLNAVLDPFAQLQSFFYNILEPAFDIDTAIGIQLDAIGERVGLPRLIHVLLRDNWFRFGDSTRGLGAGYWYDGIVSHGIAKMGDETYRTALKAKVLANKMDGTVGGRQEVLNMLFRNNPGTYPFLQDMRGMHGATCISGLIPEMIFIMLLSEGYINLATVGVQTPVIITSVSGSPIFGFGVNNNYIGGFGVGAYGVSPEVLISL